ncbi:hypothetical protein LMH87_002372 [Akanthomyces muscarius]|uniref:Uncharacterized protein n=1 Tax=Akanthomyces muscarius TaxID=2231603 RepID=A0A9W8Q9F1_AKAMU|nr:hypothetical protein LMH87_002372 [Akanthomyces muscarius]KAJ4147871.1 hypothetical protein LMH87_002372 [Akanthomyces muscarius]
MPVQDAVVPMNAQRVTRLPWIYILPRYPINLATPTAIGIYGTNGRSRTDGLVKSLFKGGSFPGQGFRVWAWYKVMVDIDSFVRSDLTSKKHLAALACFLQALPTHSKVMGNKQSAASLRKSDTVLLHETAGTCPVRLHGEREQTELLDCRLLVKAQPRCAWHDAAWPSRFVDVFRASHAKTPSKGSLSFLVDDFFLLATLNRHMHITTT